MTIRAVIFDLGGVIIGIDYNLTVEAFVNHGAAKFREIYSQSKQMNLFDQYETGKIDCSTFREGLQAKLEIYLNNEKFDGAWNAMLLDIEPDRLNTIKKIRENGYKTYLFSNTNAIHLEEVFSILERDTGLKNFDNYFDKEYYSHIFGLRKPHPDSFRALLNDIGFEAHEVVFVDDSIQHVLGAQQVGIHAFHITLDKSIHDVFSFIKIANDINLNKKESISSLSLS